MRTHACTRTYTYLEPQHALATTTGRQATTAAERQVLQLGPHRPSLRLPVRGLKSGYSCAPTVRKQKRVRGRQTSQKKREEQDQAPMSSNAEEALLYDDHCSNGGRDGRTDEGRAQADVGDRKRAGNGQGKQQWQRGSRERAGSHARPKASTHALTHLGGSCY